MTELKKMTELKIPPSLKTLGAMRPGINAYSNSGADTKARMHSSGRAFLRLLAAHLGLDKGTYEIRSNQGGIAVSGEVTLHGEHLYVQLSESCIGQGGVSVLYRRCKDRNDYCGERNHFIDAKTLAAGGYAMFLQQCERLNGMVAA